MYICFNKKWSRRDSNPRKNGAKPNLSITDDPIFLLKNEFKRDADVQSLASFFISQGKYNNNFAECKRKHIKNEQRNEHKRN